MRSEIYEKTLERNGVAFDYIEELALSEISAEKGLRNQARLDNPLDEGLAGQYEIAVRDQIKAYGKPQFPPIVVWRPGKGAWIPIDGNHRLYVWNLLRRKHIEAYTVFSTDTKVIERLIGTFNNAVNGRRISYEESLEHAISYVLKWGVPPESIAREYGVGAQVIDKRVRTFKAKEVLKEQNVKLSPSMTDEKINKLLPLQNLGHDVFAKAAEAISTTGGTIDDAAYIVKRVKSAKTHGEKLSLIEEFTKSEEAVERKAETRGGKVNVPKGDPRKTFDRQLYDLLSTATKYEKAAIIAPASKREEQRQAADELVTRLVEVFGLGSYIHSPNLRKGVS